MDAQDVARLMLGLASAVTNSGLAPSQTFLIFSNAGVLHPMYLIFYWIASIYILHFRLLESHVPGGQPT